MVKDGEPIEYTVEASDYSGHEKNITENAKDGFFVTYTHELFCRFKENTPNNLFEKMDRYG